MVGRLDDYLRDVKLDMESDVPESDIIQAGTAAIKKAHALCKAAGYESKLMPAGMRGGYHATALAGSDMTFSLSAGILTALGKETEFQYHFEEPVAPETIKNLSTIPEFVRAYNPIQLPEAEFIRFGASQRTLSQFVEAGWSMIAEFPL
jgi:transaldolase